jgi:drug/metabolite transporter (DMT)-like permease
VRQSPSGGVLRYIERFSPNTITAVFVGVAGLTFLVKAGGGLYWLIPAAVASLAGGVVNAWLFLVRQPASPHAPGSQSKPTGRAWPAGVWVAGR